MVTTDTRSKGVTLAGNAGFLLPWREVSIRLSTPSNLGDEHLFKGVLERIQFADFGLCAFRMVTILKYQPAGPTFGFEEDGT